MSNPTVGELLEHEHHSIDEGLESFAAALGGGDVRPALLRASSDALRRHVYLEEEYLFPPLRAAGMLAPVLVMLREHGVLWNLLDELDRTLDEQPVAIEDLTSRCRRLEEVLEQHNHKEERILYPAADDSLDSTDLARLREAIAGEATPTGWQCAMASQSS